MDKHRIQNLTTELLKALKEDPDRQGLVKTPERVAEAWEFLTQGKEQSISSVLEEALFEGDYRDMVIAKDIEFFSLCEHHLLPFFGRCHIAYIPNGRIVGLSKLGRIVDVAARKLQVQEQLTVEIANGFERTVKPKGVAVVTQAFHTCIAMRGVGKKQCSVTTTAMRGIFETDKDVRRDFLLSLSNSSGTFGF
jgi:GTP cyclohydrolase I